MTVYNVEIKYAGTPTPKDEAEVDEDGVISWTTIQDLPVRERELSMRFIRRICRWLKDNGGIKIEISETP